MKLQPGDGWLLGNALLLAVGLFLLPNPATELHGFTLLFFGWCGLAIWVAQLEPPPMEGPS